MPLSPATLALIDTAIASREQVVTDDTALAAATQAVVDAQAVQAAAQSTDGTDTAKALSDGMAALQAVAADLGLPWPPGVTPAKSPARR